MNDTPKPITDSNEHAKTLDFAEANFGLENASELRTASQAISSGELEKQVPVAPKQESPKPRPAAQEEKPSLTESEIRHKQWDVEGNLEKLVTQTGEKLSAEQVAKAFQEAGVPPRTAVEDAAVRLTYNGLSTRRTCEETVARLWRAYAAWTDFEKSAFEADFKESFPTVLTKGAYSMRTLNNLSYIAKELKTRRNRIVDGELWKKLHVRLAIIAILLLSIRPILWIQEEPDSATFFRFIRTFVSILAVWIAIHLFRRGGPHAIAVMLCACVLFLNPFWDLPFGQTALAMAYVIMCAPFVAFIFAEKSRLLEEAKHDIWLRHFDDD